MKFYSSFTKISTILFKVSPSDKKLAKLQGTLDFDNLIWILDNKPLVWGLHILTEFG